MQAASIASRDARTYLTHHFGRWLDDQRAQQRNFPGGEVATAIAALDRAGRAGAPPGHGVGSATIHPLSEDAIADGSPATGRMEIVLADGRRVIVDRAVDGSALARVIAVLERR